ncbi:hypothetical protein [uncultured Corynebacterium sp.]|uniref:hypothetical protein n=1 Tax=uncultured Corynebacterium sp. TaxID=159447 RepID=UPI0025E8BC1F|nr:hypothetical protein [uncultured Corynebacterium sp.]
MTTPTREQIEAAYDALEELYYAACALNLHGSHDTEEEWHSAILKVLPPKPRPTMADIEWLDSVHYLAEAKHKDGRTVIMLTRDSSTRINFIWNESIDATHPQNLTPTGKRYTLTEVQE